MGIFQTINREVGTLLTLQRFKKWTDDIDPDSANLVADDFERAVDKYPNNVAWRFEGQLITYAEMDALANKAANFLKAIPRKDNLKVQASADSRRRRNEPSSASATRSRASRS